MYGSFGLTREQLVEDVISTKRMLDKAQDMPCSCNGFACNCLKSAHTKELRESLDFILTELVACDGDK